MKNSTFFLHFRSLGKNTTTISISTQDSQRGAKIEKKDKKEEKTQPSNHYHYH